ncbi:hypothetical protein I6H88_18440 [Elizabethkingia bruuniana]|uniref:Cytochrome C551 n=1 Tax=Elizabethkingia bruuniana TaxID=1756149 RepID=A0A7T7UY62_9FLAO|nr:hypothetical protein [Elizabethkingia bruuniana]KGO10905.1 hypothetical protein KS04_06465 [Elizabethkingia miricola]AQX84905.1 hypothetical protein AYC65_07735 [Elizabethkingia bruuniana]KUY28911.1 hypothetical protein ATB97_01935 [Elizabethkingia bruuniana]OPB70541.1 hypothetical protein BAY12_18045 [Elizabethkingia bruuniana]QDZ62632.1 hypothetical protein EVD20_07475 [Elizabethkingia bruuniana]
MKIKLLIFSVFVLSTTIACTTDRDQDSVNADASVSIKNISNKIKLKKTQPAKTAEAKTVLLNPSETIDPTKSDRPK